MNVDPRLQQHLELATRKLGPSVRARLLLLGPGGWGWSLALTVLALAYVMGLQDAWVNYVVFNTRDVGTTVGRVLSADDTNVELNDRAVSVIEYRYEVDGNPLEGFSFAREWYPAEGKTVPVEYLRGHPGISRIKNTNFAKFGMFPPILVGVAVLCACYVAFRVRRTILWIGLLRSGRPAGARLIEKKATGSKVNDAPVYKLVYSIDDGRGRQRRWTIKTHAIEDITDDDEEPALVDPDRVGRVLLLDQLPFEMSVGRIGVWDAANPRGIVTGLLVRLALPALIIGMAHVF